ncbi:hypothetical protein H9P43_008966 [Blastocladiella emersonii ATCC 22665]|nr:hypothetical protein H9P43_008966 [Blastocladiella emersonii ATCC 22665]
MDSSNNDMKPATPPTPLESEPLLHRASPTAIASPAGAGAGAGRAYHRYVLADDGVSDSEGSALPSPVRVEDDPSTTSSSFFACFLNLANVAIGVGTLSLPRAVANVGWLGGLVLLLASSATSAASLVMLVVSAEATGAAGYTDLAAKIFARRSWVVTWTFFVLVIGSLSAYFSVIASYISTLLAAAGVVSPHATEAAVLGVTLLVIFPLSTARSMANLAFASSLSLLAIMLVVVLVPLSYLFAVRDPAYVPPPLTPIAAGWDRWLPTASTFAMAFLNHSNVVEIARDLPSPPPFASATKSTTSRAVRLIVASSAFVAAVYATVGLAGYAHYGGDVKPNILQSEPASGAFLAARAGILACMVLSFPMIVYPCRLCVAQMADEVRGYVKVSEDEDEVVEVREETNVKSKAAGIITLAYAVSRLVPALDRILGLTGSLAGSLVVYVFPAVWYLALAREGSVARSWPLRVAAGVNVLVGAGLFAVGTVYSLGLV